jgi:hypothetical protein
MRQTGAGTIKIAIPAARLTDALALLPIAAGGDAVVIAMGDAGLPSRLLASRFQSRWTYAGDAVAPGQIPSSRMLDEFRFRDVQPTTDIYGVVSNNVTHSMSPVMHNAALRAADLDGVYVPLRAADFDDFLTFADAMKVAGASVTIPFKLDALRAAHRADALTRAVGRCEHTPPNCRRLGSDKYGRAGLSRSARCRLSGFADRRTGCGARCRRCRPRCRRRAPLPRCRRHDSRSPSGTGAGSRRGMWSASG